MGRLREALCLWRGPAFANVAGLEHVQSEIRRLEELRLVAMMDRVGATLQQTERVCQERTYEILSAQFDEATLGALLDDGRKTITGSR